MQHQQYTQARLSQPALLILASLAQGPRHVIAVQEAIEQTEGLYIEPGTLYRVVAQLERRGWKLLRLLPVALLIVIFFMLPFHNGWLNGLFLGLFLASLVLVAERGGAMLISARRWQERQSPLLATLVRLLALLAISGMVAVCIDTGVWLVDQWDVLPQINLSSPGLCGCLLLASSEFPDPVGLPGFSSIR